MSVIQPRPTEPYFPEVIDSSMIAEFKACPAKFKFSYIDEWKPKVPSTHLHAGAAFARGLEVSRRAFYEQDLPAEDCLAHGVQALLEFYGDHQPPSFGTAANKTAIRTAGALEYYFDNYPLNHNAAYPVVMPGGKRGIEFSFANTLPIPHPITGQPLQYCGRADGIFNFAGGTYIFDEKTASQLGETWGNQWKLRAQLSGYCWAAEQSGLKVDGVVVRGVAFYKNGYGISENVSFRSDYMLSTWYTELLEWIDQIIYCFKRNSWSHNFDHACADFGGCQYHDICDMPDTLPWLERSHERRHWDPITRTETKLL